MLLTRMIKPLLCRSTTKLFQPTILRLFPSFERATSLCVENLPMDWDEKKVVERFSVTGAIQNVVLIKNKLGVSSGKGIRRGGNDSDNHVRECGGRHDVVQEVPDLVDWYAHAEGPAIRQSCRRGAAKEAARQALQRSLHHHRGAGHEVVEAVCGDRRDRLPLLSVLR